MRISRYITLILFIAGLASANAQNWIGIHTDQPVAAETSLVSTSPNGSIISVNINGFILNQVETPRGNAFTVSVDNGTPVLEKGMPDLPKLAASLIIPDLARMDVRILSSQYIDYPFMDVAPSKGNFTRDIDPSTVPFEYGRAYSRDEFFPSAQAGLRQPYILRDHRGQTVVIYPFAYNPVTRTLRVYHTMTIEVISAGTSDENIFIRNGVTESVDAEFNQIYNRHFLNSDNGSRYTPVEEQGNMLIISYGSYLAEMQDFVDWKRTIGIPTEIVDVATIGANPTAIRNYVADYYATNGLTFLLLVGDHAQVPTVTTGDLGGPSDHSYGYLAGNDHYPDIFVGRFSAENATQVATQVQRTLEYEQNPDVTVDWFSKGFGIGSSEGPGDDGEYDWQHMRNIRTDLIGYTYTSIGELYDGSQGGEDLPGNPNSASVATEVNDGRSIINYVGHGSETSWGTTGFSNSGVNGLTNNNRWPFIWSVACVNGDFLNGTCFAEAWLRATNANGPTGAVATLMSTINQSWNPPMEGQDEMNDILVESYNDNIKRTFGGLSMNGCMKMNDTYGSDGDEMTDTWLIFGDPSLMVRTALPTTLSVNHNPVAFIGSDQFVVNCNVQGALACLTIDGQIIGTAFVNGGSAIITFTTLNNVGTMKLAVTAFNHLPYIADIDILPLEGPYVVYNNLSINDATGNNNQQVDYNESVAMALGLKNVGTEDATDIAVTISSSDPYIELTDVTEMYPLIAAGQTVAIADGFAFVVSNDVPDGHPVLFDYTAISGENEWSGSFTVVAHSVALNFAGTSVTDEQGNNNGKADPGETFQLHLSIINAGTAPGYNLTGILSTEDPYLIINVDSLNYGTINGYETLTSVFTVTSLPSTPTGHIAEFNLLMYADSGFETSSVVTIVIGQIPVLIIDLDANHNSGTVMHSCLTNLSVSSDYVATWPLVLGPYQSIFVCLGTYSDNGVLSDAQGQALANFLSAGGKVYMEGGDTWAYNTPTPVHPMFMIDGETDGSGDLSTISGMEQSMVDGMSFGYTGDNSYIDRLLPLETATPLFRNLSPSYYTAIAYDGGTYKTIGSSFEFGGLQDGSNRSVKDSLMMQYIEFFGISGSAPLLANFLASDNVVCEFEEIIFTDFSAGNIDSWEWSFPGGDPATSADQNPVVSYREPGTYDVTLTVSDGVNTSTTVKSGYITVDFCMGTENPERRNEVRVFPNPSNGSFAIETKGVTGISVVKLLNSTGQIIHSDRVSANGYYEIDFPGLASGVYMLSFENQDFRKVFKIIIK
ncbi:MAG: C25 family cysteine peptidase [Bacteroidota bacterium]